MMGLTPCYKTAVFLHFIFAVFSITIHSGGTTTSALENKRTPYRNSISGFDVNIFIVIFM